MLHLFMIFPNNITILTNKTFYKEGKKRVPAAAPLFSLYSKQIYSASEILSFLFIELKIFPNRTKMHLNEIGLTKLNSAKVTFTCSSLKSLRKLVVFLLFVTWEP